MNCDFSVVVSLVLITHFSISINQLDTRNIHKMTLNLIYFEGHASKVKVVNGLQIFSRNPYEHSPENQNISMNVKKA